MFHSFTFSVNSAGQIIPKKSAYYNMGNPGSAGCIRLLMNHAKWIYDNIDPGTYVVVNSNRATDSSLRSVLKKYVPLLGYDMTASWDGNRNNIEGLPKSDFVHTPDVVTPPTAAPTVSPTVAPSEIPTDAPSVSPTDAPTVTDAPTDAPTEAPTQTEAPVITPAPTEDNTPEGIEFEQD